MTLMSLLLTHSVPQQSLVSAQHKCEFMHHREFMHHHHNVLKYHIRYGL